MAIWFECKVRYDKIQQESGAVKTVNEPYLVDATSFTEAESRIIEELTPYISGEFTISAVKKTRISEIIDGDGDRYFMVKMNLISYDEKSGKEKKTAQYVLVQADDLEDAIKVFKEGMKGTVSDISLAQVSESPLCNVFPYKP